MKNNLIAISGKIGSGKDSIGLILQLLSVGEGNTEIKGFVENNIYYLNSGKDYQIKKFADKLKDIACLLIGCTREDLESQEFKNTELGEEWNMYTVKRKDKSPFKWEYITVDFDSKEEAEAEYALIEEKDKKHWEITTKKMTPRLLLQLLGTDCGRDIIHPNIWVNALFADWIEVKGMESVPENRKHVYQPQWIITDCRFPNEAKAVSDRGGIVIRVNRPMEIRVQHSGREDDFSIEKFDSNNPKHVDFKKGYDLNQHASETALDDYQDFDHVIENDGSVEDLIEKIRNLNLT